MLEPYNLGISQFALLMQLKNEHGERLTTLSRRLLLSKSTITRIVDQLEHAKLVERINDPTDRRAQRVILTPDGLDVRDKAHEAHEESLGRRLDGLSEEEQQQADELLTKIRSCLRTDLGQRDID